MASLKELLAKSKKSVEDKKNIPSNNQDILYGTGVTKKLASAAEKEQEKLQQQSYHLVKESEDFGTVINLQLPDSLMDSSITLDEFQLAAVKGLEKQKYGCLIGQAGVGKTTTAKALINRLLKNIETIDLNQTKLENKRSKTPDYNVAVCIGSFMGKAVQQIKRALPKQYHPLCNTIHSILGYAPMDEVKTDSEGNSYYVKVFRPQFTKLNKLPYKLCVLDEAGSIPVFLFNELVDALPDDCRIILMGDLNQLPPVSGHAILGFAILSWPTFVLSKIHRQSGGSPIIDNSDRIIHGKKPLPDPAKFIIKEIPDSAFESFQHSLAVIQSLSKSGVFDPMVDAFIVPQNKDTLGQIAFNERLVRFFNPVQKIDGIPINPPVIIKAGWQNVTFAIGDKVMLTANDRDLGLTNGMIGVVKELIPNPRFKGDAIADQVIASLHEENFSLDLSNLHEEINQAEKEVDEDDTRERQASHIMTVKFQNVETTVTFASAGSYNKIVHSYAITCHKAQGSEYPTVIILAHSANAIMLSREWLYTAVTRARERVILLTNQRGLTKAVNRQMIKGTTIEEKAKKFIALSKKEDAETPKLGEPLEV